MPCYLGAAASPIDPLLTAGLPFSLLLITVGGFVLLGRHAVSLYLNRPATPTAGPKCVAGPVLGAPMAAVERAPAVATVPCSNAS